MEFVFEGKKKRGYGDRKPDPGFPAVKITKYTDKHPGRSVFRFVFSEKAIEVARWILGDQLEVGVDTPNGLIALKRSPNTGYKITGRGFSDVNPETNETPGFQFSTGPKSPIAILAMKKQNVWLRLSPVGVLMVTERIQDEPEA